MDYEWNIDDIDESSYAMDYDSCIEAITEGDWKAFGNNVDIIVQMSNENTLTMDGNTITLRTHKNLAPYFGIFDYYEDKFHVKSDFEYNDCSYDHYDFFLKKLYFDGEQPILPNLVLNYAFSYTLDNKKEINYSLSSSGIVIKKKHGMFDQYLCFKVYCNDDFIGKFSVHEHDNSRIFISSYHNNDCVNTSFDEGMYNYLPGDEIERALFESASYILDKWIA